MPREPRKKPVTKPGQNGRRRGRAQRVFPELEARGKIKKIGNIFVLKMLPNGLISQIRMHSGLKTKRGYAGLLSKVPFFLERAIATPEGSIAITFLKGIAGPEYAKFGIKRGEEIFLGFFCKGNEEITCLYGSDGDLRAAIVHGEWKTLLELS
jgi:hypothetical protein